MWLILETNMDYLAKLITHVVNIALTIGQYALCSWTFAPMAGFFGAIYAVIDEGHVSGQELKKFLYFWYYPYILKVNKKD